MNWTLGRMLLAGALLLPGLAEAGEAQAGEAQGGEAVAPLPEAALDVAAQLRAQALAGSGAWEVVESLTTEVGPRMAGTEADARAVAWAVEKFGGFGFDRVYSEPVRFPVWRRGHERAEVLSPFPQPLHLAALGRSVGTGGQPLEAEVVEFATLADLEAAPEGSLLGRIAYVSHRMERFRDGSGYGAAVAARGKGASVAARHGAVAFLLRSIGTDSDRFPHTGMTRYEDDVRQIPAAALSNPDADLLSNMLRRGEPVKLRLDIDVGMGAEYESANVIAEIRGRERPDEIILLGSHLDSWDLGTGAIDNAAGVAITVRAAALIAALPQRPRRTIRVVAFANEEQGLIGGRAYADAHGERIAEHVVGVESDFGAGRIYAFATSEPPPQAQRVLEQIAQALAPLGIDYMPGKGGPGPDLIPIAQRGMPWAWLAQDGTDYFDYHHTHNDTLDKVEAAALDQNVAAYAVFAWLMAESDVVLHRPDKSGESPGR
ncbi:M20/M25/M40 family metallo-hydrolase [Denitratimonas sp. CY0512]|uniref:M20/M25/M40 family metallo-hydrolase n=1 Tax=Denitratimonas sp. CY0512 TaxID=3131940 RepID=UPI0030B0199B